MNLPNLKHLQYFLSLHEHQNFNRAAAACYVSQSTLSSAILKLEEQLHCQLIERDHKSFIFTAQGLSIVKMARELLVSTNELVTYAQQQGNPNGGSIRIGCIHTIAPYLLTDFLHSCQKNIPDLSLYLIESTTENLMLMLANGEIDLIVLALPVGKHGFKSKVVGKDSFYLAGNSELVRHYSENKDYKGLPPQSVFLLSEEHCLTDHAVSACNFTDKSLINPFLASSISTLIQMTSYHNGMTFLPSMAVKKGVGVNENLTITKLDNSMYRDIGIMWRPTTVRQQLFLKLADLISDLL
ncbi:LysR substrate-binding domain-containing protein [Colwellia sp. RE-S-Sl-9]